MNHEKGASWRDCISGAMMRSRARTRAFRLMGGREGGAQDRVFPARGLVRIVEDGRDAEVVAGARRSRGAVTLRFVRCASRRTWRASPSVVPWAEGGSTFGPDVRVVVQFWGRWPDTLRACARGSFASCSRRPPWRRRAAASQARRRRGRRCSSSGRPPRCARAPTRCAGWRARCSGRRCWRRG